MSITKTCIVCPKGCSLSIDVKSDGSIEVAGNQCKRGVNFAVEEMTNPQRTLQTTVKTVFADFERLPVKTSDTIPKDKFFEVMDIAKSLVVDSPVSVGDVVAKNILGLNVNLVATANVRI